MTSNRPALRDRPKVLGPVDSPAVVLLVLVQSQGDDLAAILLREPVVPVRPIAVLVLVSLDSRALQDSVVGPPVSVNSFTHAQPSWAAIWATREVPVHS